MAEKKEGSSRRDDPTTQEGQAFRRRARKARSADTQTPALSSIAERKRLEGELDTRIQLAQFQATIGLALVGHGELAARLQACTQALVESFGAAFARIWTLDASGQVLELQASAGLYTHLDGPHSRIPVGQSKIGRIAQAREPHLTNRILDDPEVTDQAWARREGILAFAGYPLLVADHTVGVMAMFARHPLSERDLLAIATVANHIALAIQRQQAEAALRQSEAGFRQVWETTQDALALSDADGIVLAVNPAYLRLYGYRAEQVIGQSFAIIFPQDVRAWAVEQYRVVFAGEEIPPPFESTVVQADGSARIVESSATFITTAGQRTAMLSTIRDISARKQAEETTAYLAAIVQASGDAILGIGSDGLIQSWNPAAERLFGYSAAEATGQSVHILAPLDHYPEQDELLARLQAGESVRRETVRLTKSGKRVDVLVNSAPLLNAAGQVVGISATFVDMSLRKQAHLAEIRHQLIQAQEAERRHLAREIHDGPVQELAALGFDLDFLAARLTDPAFQAEIVAFRTNLTQIIHRLRRTMIMLRPPMAVDMGLASALQEAVDEIHYLQPALTLVVELPPVLPALSADLLLMLYRITQQALYNVVQHAQAQQAWVRVRVDAGAGVDVDAGVAGESATLLLEVQDDGQGFVVPREWVELARAQHLGVVGMVERAELIGGHLEIQSTLGQGTRVRVTIPLAPNKIIL